MVLIDHVYNRVGEDVTSGTLAKSRPQCFKDFFTSPERHAKAKPVDVGRKQRDRLFKFSPVDVLVVPSYS